MRILHVTALLSRGGAGRALVAMAKYVARLGAYEQAIVTLRASEKGARLLAQEAGLEVVEAPSADIEARMIAAADIVHIHFWNAPELYAWLRRGLPPTRVVLTQHVAGEYPAQVMTRAARDFADRVLLTTPLSLRLPVYTEMDAAEREKRVTVLRPGPDFERVDGVAPKAHTGFRVGYVGMVGFIKMHPRFVAMSVAAKLGESRFVVCGAGDGRRTLERQVQALGAADRFEWLDYTEDVGSVFETLDVFGYPLRYDTYASAELVLQEAMFSGVPGVLMRDCAPSLLVEHGVTGLLAESEADYTACLELLERDAALRGRLASAASEWARTQAGAERAARALHAVYADLLERPRRRRAWPATPPLSPHAGANAMIEAWGDAAGPFRTSLLAADGTDRREAEAHIASLSPVATDAGGGGVLHYRGFYPEDPYLRLWSGLVLLENGRPALAAAELQRAVALGLESERVREYLSEAMARVG